MAARFAALALPAVIFALQLGSISGQSETKAMNFHFAHIDWKMCQDTTRDGKVIPGFYDPAYPEVCLDRSNRRKVGFTLHAQWPNGGVDQLSMLMDFATQIVAFRDQCNSTLLYDPPPGKEDGKLCYLSVSFGSDPAMQRKIGWRKGLGENSIPLTPAGEVTAAAKFAGGESRDDEPQRYNFVIERESPDLKTVYARFSWEIEFDESNQYYTVFWEGCCRPATLKNNAGLVYHVRTEVFVNSDASTAFPLSSFKFTVPADVTLKHEGPGACEQLYCNPSDCFIDYRIQGYHEQPEWHEKVYFRKGTDLEMGRYKCMEKEDVTNPESALVWRQQLCPDSHTVTSFTEPDYRMYDSSAPLRNVGALDSVAGVVRFEMQQDTGVYQQSVVAEILLPNGVRLAHVLDSKVKVAVMSYNDQPFPYVPPFSALDFTEFAAGETPVNILSGAWNDVEPSYPIKSTPIQIQCGKSLFFLDSIGALRPDGGPRNSTDAMANSLGTSIDFAFKDPDFRRPDGSCGQNEGQTIDFVDAANMLPKGLTVSETFHNDVNGVSRVELHWTPQCEDRSQVGLFQVCFYAKDKSDSASHVPSYSVPSAYPSFWTQRSPDVAIQYHPTCIFLNSMPPAPNPAPVLYTRDSSGRPRIPPVCCGTTFGQSAVPFPECVSAGATGTDGSGLTVGNEYVLGCIQGRACNSVYELTISAQAENDFFKTDIRFFYPDATVINYFVVSEPKYGCDELNFDECVSNANVRRKVARKLTVNIEPNMANQLRICYQGFQTAPGSVDENKWESLYGESATSQSCVTCYILNLINAPIWPAESVVDNSLPIKVAAGKTTSIKLTARNLGSGATNIFILADPGAPDGSRLGAIKQEDSQFSRVFEYTPTAAQAGLTSKVCFTASTVQEGSSDPVDSIPLCYEFTVVIDQLTWNADPCPFDHSGSCGAQGVQLATVGCKTRSTIKTAGDDNQLYAFTLQFKKYPSCDNCFRRAGDFIGASGDGYNISAVIEVVECDGDITTECCGDQICNGAETESGCPKDCPKDHSSSLVLHVDNQGRSRPEQGVFEFTPMRQHQGRQLLICIEATTDAGNAVISQKRTSLLSPSICIVFDVESCRYCMPPGATLKSVARHYFLNVDWLRLYNNNPEVTNPDMLLPEKKIQVGPMYSVAPGDTLLSVAATMKTTVKMIMQNNPNIPEDGMIKPGNKVCVLLCSNA